MDGLHQPPHRYHAIAALVIVNAMWGASFPVMKGLNLEIDQHFAVTEWTASAWLRAASAAWMISIRFGVALVLFCLVFHRVLRRVGRIHLLAGMAIGTMFFLGLLLQVIGLATIPASRSGFLTSLGVVITPLFSTLLKRQLPRQRVLAGTLVALAGVAILTGLIEFRGAGFVIAPDALSRWTWGDSLTTLGAFFFSGQILLVDHFGKHYDSIAFTPSMFATTSLLAAVVFLLLRPNVPEIAPWTDPSWTALATQPRFFGLIAVLCLFPSLLAFAWMNKYQPVLSAVQAAVIYTLEPVFASLWAMVLPGLLSVWCGVHYLNEQFSAPLVIGGALVLVANALALWPQRRRRTNGNHRDTPNEPVSSEPVPSEPIA